MVSARTNARDYEALRGRILLWLSNRLKRPGRMADLAKGLEAAYFSVSEIALDLGVTRQAVYRAAPELQRIAPRFSR